MEAAVVEDRPVSSAIYRNRNDTRTSMRPTRTRPLAVAAVALSAILLTGCLQSQDAGPVADETVEGDGVIQILGAFPSPESDAFEASLADFEQRSGIDVTYVPSTDFTTEIRT